MLVAHRQEEACGSCRRHVQSLSRGLQQQQSEFGQVSDVIVAWTVDGETQMTTNNNLNHDDGAAAGCWAAGLPTDGNRRSSP